MAGFVFVSLMIVALFAAIPAWYVRSSSATTVLLKVTLLRSCLPIWSSALFALAIASFIDASIASGVCSQLGIVSTAFALAAAARKSSTDFSSPAQRSTTAAQSKIDKHKVFIRKGLIAEDGEHCVERSFRKVDIPEQIA